jgi:predicted enzyme related to lactoylglutathione lyase
MLSSEPSERGRILGIGGIFFKSPGAKELRAWYEEKLGIKNNPYGAMFPWKSVEAPNREHLTVWTVFPATTKKFEPSNAGFMINYIVDDLDALLKKLEAGGMKLDSKPEDSEYGRFAWIYDPDGNKIELWEPPPDA